MIKDDDVEKALDYLTRNAQIAAQARADRVYMEQYTKVVKARIMSESNSLAINAQERNALVDSRFLEQLEAERTAVFEDERHRFLREAAKAKLEAWRTEKATERAMAL